MPADPQLPEKAMLNTLADVEHPVTSTGMRQLMLLILLACYDRKVERDFMASMLYETTELHELIGDMESAERCRIMCEDMKIIDISKQYEKEIQDSLEKFCAMRTSLAKKFSLVTQCPTTGDKIS